MKLESPWLVVAAAAAVLGLGLLKRGAKTEADAPPARPTRVAALAPADGGEGERWVEGPLLAEETGFEFAVYHLTPPGLDTAALAKKLAAERPALRAAGVLAVDLPAIRDYAPLGPDSLQYFGRGLSEAQVQALQTASAVTRLRVRTPGTKAVSVLRELESVVAEIARQAGGLIWDEETRLCWSQEAWTERTKEAWDGETPVVKRHTTAHAYRKGKLVRGITLGMAKFALPDVVIEEMEARNIEPMGLLMSLVGQTLLATPEVSPGGKLALDLGSEPGRRVVAPGEEPTRRDRKATVGLAQTTPEEGDPRNRLMKIVFPAGPGQTVGEAQVAALDALFELPDSMKYVRHDAELEAASAKARKHLFEVVKPRFLKGLDGTEALSVKAPFEMDSGGQEWMWVEVHEWQGEEIKGRLGNEPFDIAALHSGAEVSFDQDVVFDYLIRRSDGTSEGNETGKIIDARMGPERKK